MSARTAPGRGDRGAALRVELLEREARDQETRATLDRGDGRAIARAIELDAENTAWLKAVVDELGWPGRSLVGEQGAHAAWLLAQHADRDPGFQRRCLALLKRSVDQGEASPAELAYLTDRVLVNSGRPQRYGTQLTAVDGHLVPQELEDPDAVDPRRVAAGLEPLADYLRRATERYGPPVPTPIPCRNCGAAIPVWPPAPGRSSSADCPACGRRITVQGHPPGAKEPPSRP